MSTASSRMVKENLAKVRFYRLSEMFQLGRIKTNQQLLNANLQVTLVNKHYPTNHTFIHMEKSKTIESYTPLSQEIQH